MAIQDDIDKINAILAGPERTTIGDRTVVYDFASLRRQRDDLIRQLKGGSQFRKVVFHERQ